MPLVKLFRRFPILAGAHFLPLALCLVLNTPAQALEPSKGLTQYVQEVFQQEEGLPENDVTAIVQTRDGYIWLGTGKGWSASMAFTSPCSTKVTRRN